MLFLFVRSFHCHYLPFKLLQCHHLTVLMWQRGLDPIQQSLWNKQHNSNHLNTAARLLKMCFIDSLLLLFFVTLVIGQQHRKWLQPPHLNHSVPEFGPGRIHTWWPQHLEGGGGWDKDLIMREEEETALLMASGTGTTRQRIVQIRPALSVRTHLWPWWFNCTEDFRAQKNKM